MRAFTGAIVCLLALTVVGCARATARDGGGRARAAAQVRSGALALITEPGPGSAPFVSLIDRARRSIEMTMYELDDPAVESALVAAARRGVVVRVLLNGGYGDAPEATNDAAFAYLSDHGVDVRHTPTFFALTHQKTLTIDDAESVVMTLNLTSRYYATSRDFAVLDSDGADVRAILATFDADWAGRRIDPSDGSGDLVWSPGSAPELLRLIGSARRSLAVENEEMADPAVTDALCAAARRHVSVRVVMTDASAWAGAFDQLGRCGVQVAVDHGEHPVYIHAKVIDVDAAEAFVGSENFSRGSLDANRELGIVLTAPALVRSLTATLAGDFAAAQPYR